MTPVDLTTVFLSRARTVFDVGANYGGYLEPFLQYPVRQIFAFEPVPWLHAQLTYKYQGNNRVHVLPFGVSDVAEKAVALGLYQNWTICHYINSRGLKPVEAPTFDVEFVTLDSIVANIGLDDVDYVKIDTDGYEYKVLSGTRRLLEVQRPTLHLELSYLPERLGEGFGSVDDIWALLKTCGYTVYPLAYKGSPLPQIEAFTEAKFSQLDVLAVHESRQGSLPSILV